MIKVNDQFRLTADKYTIIMERLSPVTNKKTDEVSHVWKIHGYYGSLKQVRRALTELHVKQLLANPEYTACSQLLVEAENLANTTHVSIVGNVPDSVWPVTMTGPKVVGYTEVPIKRGRGRPKKARA